MAADAFGDTLTNTADEAFNDRPSAGENSADMSNLLSPLQVRSGIAHS